MAKKVLYYPKSYTGENVNIWNWAFRETQFNYWGANARDMESIRYYLLVACVSPDTSGIYRFGNHELRPIKTITYAFDEGDKLLKEFLKSRRVYTRFIEGYPKLLKSTKEGRGVDLPKLEVILEMPSRKFQELFFQNSMFWYLTCDCGFNIEYV